MALIGKRNLLPLVRAAAPGFYLDGGTQGEILLPNRYVPPDAAPGGKLSVFVYRDSEDRLVATTERPYVTVGQCAYLKVAATNPRLGAFLDWGLSRDLLLPLREQSNPLQKGDWVVVYVLLDAAESITASARLDRWLGRAAPAFVEGEKVELLVFGETPLGYKAVVNHSHEGLLYRGEMSGTLAIGQPLSGYVRTIRPDGKIDLALDAEGYQRIQPLTAKILQMLQSQSGWLPYSDQSSPEEIRVAFGVSKKAFKQAVGSLYRKEQIQLEPGGLRLRAK